MRRRQIGRPIAVVVALVPILLGMLVLGCGSGDGRDRTVIVNDNGGELVSATRIGSVNRRDARTLIADAGLHGRVRSGATAYRIVYRTVDTRGRTTTASGLLAVPRDVRRPLPLVLYDHGSIVSDTEAPSELQTREGAPVAAFFASAGFAYAAPDYLGRGTGPGTPAYLDAKTEASASRDLLEAAAEFMRRRRVALSSDLFVAGYSQGGQAAIALGELLTRRPLDDVALRAVASISGPHDFSGAVWQSLVARDQPEDENDLLFLAMLLSSWQSAYGLFPGERVFQQADNATVAELFDSDRSIDDLRALIPQTLPELVTPGVLAQLRSPRGALARALQRNDGCKAQIGAPVRLYQGSADTLVLPENAERCRQLLTDLGDNVRVVDLGPIGHGESLTAALPRVLSWFTSLARH